MTESPQALDGRGFQFLLLIVAGTSGAIAARAFGALQVTMQAALSLSDNQIALLVGATQIPMVIAAVPLGLIVDRYSRVRLMLIFAVLKIAGSLLTALASNFMLLFAGRCLVVLGGAAMVITGYSLLADFFAPAQRGRAKAVMVVCQYAGASAAFALGGAMMVNFASGPDGWRWATFWLTVPLGLAAFSMLAMREPPRAGRIIKNPSTRETWIEMWRYRAIIAPLMAGLVMLDVAMFAIHTWAAPTLSRQFSLAPDRVGAIMATALMVSGVVGPIAGGIIADRCQRGGRPRRTMLVLGGLSLLSLPCSLFAIAPGVEWVSALLVMFMTVTNAAMAMGLTLFTVLIPNELRGLSLSLWTAANVIVAGVLAPLLVSLLSGAMGGPAMIGKALALTCMTACLLGAVVCAFGSRSFPQATVK